MNNRVSWPRSNIIEWIDASVWCNQQNITVNVDFDSQYAWIDFTTVEDCVLFKLSCLAAPNQN